VINCVSKYSFNISVVWTVHYHFHNRPPLVTVLCQINPVNLLQTCSFRVRFSIIFPSSRRLPSVLLPSYFPTMSLLPCTYKMPRPSCLSSCTTGEQLVMHSPVTTPSFISLRICLSTLYSDYPSLCSSLNVSDHVSHPCKAMSCCALSEISTLNYKRLLVVFMCQLR
jgi:hypothetical protein